jgi:hypothetical protein
MKTTKWFDGSKTAPFHVGVYKVKPAYRGARSYFSYWDGKKFCGISKFPDAAKYIGIFGLPLHLTDFGWQGLAVKP